MENESPLKVGNKVFIRTVTNYYTGLIVNLTEQEIVLTDAAWIADTGRFSNALKTGVFVEVEPYPNGSNVSISRGATVDASIWNHDLPRTTK